MHIIYNIIYYFLFLFFFFQNKRVSSNGLNGILLLCADSTSCLYHRSAVAATSYTSPVNSIALPVSRFYLTSGGRLGIVRGPN